MLVILSSVVKVWARTQHAPPFGVIRTAVRLYLRNQPMYLPTVFFRVLPSYVLWAYFIKIKYHVQWNRLPSLGDLHSGCGEILSYSSLLDVPIRFHSYRLFKVHFDMGPLSQVPVHRFPHHRTTFSVWKSLAIGTSLCQVSGISHQVFWNSLLNLLCLMGIAPPLDNLIYTVSRNRRVIFRVQVIPGFDLSTNPSSGLCWRGDTFHLYPVKQTAHW